MQIIVKLTFKSEILKSIFKKNFLIHFLFLFFSYIQICVKLYHLNIINIIKKIKTTKKKLPKDIPKSFQRKRKKSSNMGMKVTKVSEKVK